MDLNTKEFIDAVLDKPELLNICARYVDKNRFVCSRCGKPKVSNSYYRISNSQVYKAGRLPICKTCTEKLFNYYKGRYGSKDIAVERMCLLFDLYFDKNILLKCGDNPKTIMGKYIKNLNLRQYKKLNTYDLTKVTYYFSYLMRRRKPK